MFSKALFKQSCKANGTMWGIITFAVCFMLACVMMISGSGNIGNVAVNVEDTIITKEIDSAIEDRAINYYSLSSNGTKQFDIYYSDDFAAEYPTSMAYGMSFEAWLASQPNRSSYGTDEEYQEALLTWNNSMPQADTLTKQVYALTMSTWLKSVPNQADYQTSEEYYAALASWSASKPDVTSTIINAAGTSAYKQAVDQLQEYVVSLAKQKNPLYTADSTQTKEMLGAILYPINPNHAFDDFYTEHNETIPEDYDIASLISHVASGDIDTYLTSKERCDYIYDRSSSGTAMFLAANMTTADVKKALIATLSQYGVTEEKYDSFNYTYDSIKHKANTTSVSYQARYDYEYSLLKNEFDSGAIASQEEFDKQVKQMDENLTRDISNSLLASLPEEVSSALQEVGKMDLYGLIVGSVFYKMAGLLLPIIYMIMASNNLIAGQVDSGSMAYVLSTSTKRKTVVFTQAIFLISSLFAMFACTTITSCICFSQVSVLHTGMTYAKLVLINLGAFIVLFAMSGICFLASCWFDRSKNAMALGGGLSMFFLVCTMLGLFGSQVIPSVVRFDALNYFNYVSLISLFDVISIIDGTNVFIWKLAILVGVGLIGYLVGSIKFEKTDLPL